VSKIYTYIRTKSTKKEEVFVRFRLYFKGKFYYYTSSIRVKPLLWDSTNCLVGFRNHFTDPLFREVNNQILNIHDLIQEIFDNRSDYEIISSEWLTNNVENELSRRRLKNDLTLTPLVSNLKNYIDNHKMSTGRRKSYNIIYTTFMTFEKYYSTKKSRKTIFTYNKVDNEILDMYFDFLKNEHLIYLEFSEIYKDSEIKKVNLRSDNCVKEYLKKFRCFIKDIQKKTRSSYYPFEGYRIKLPIYDKPVVLRQEELKTLYDFETNDEILELVKDNFLLHTAMGPRIGDFKKLKFKDILLETNAENGKQINYLEFYPQKTWDSSGKQVCIPLSGLATNIILKYKGKSDYLIPHYSDQYYNKKLKELFEKAGLNRMVTRRNTKTHETERIELFNLATSHISRRSLISILHNKGYEEELVNELSGHVSKSEVKSRYLDFELKTKFNCVNDIFPWVEYNVIFDINNNQVIQLSENNQVSLDKKYNPFNHVKRNLNMEQKVSLNPMSLDYDYELKFIPLRSV